VRLTAAITTEDRFWVARCLEVDVTSQGESLDEARANLTEALELYFEDDPAMEPPQSPIIAPIDIRIAG